MGSKGAHYSLALAHALAAGAWSSPSPAATPRAAPLSWPELVRKWGKHTGGNTPLIHHLRDISLLYLSTTNRPVHAPFLAPATSSPASTDSAAYLSPADLDGDDANDQRAWSNSQAWWSPVPADETAESISDLQALIASGKLSPAELVSAKLILAYYLHATGSHDAALRVYHSVDWAADSHLGVLDGDAAVVGRLRARCLQGLSYELAPTPDDALALQSLLATVPLFQSLAAQPSFADYREACRFFSTALFRAAILSARQPGHALQTLAVLRTFHAYSASWPPAFRPVQRQKMLILYLQTLSLSARPSRQWEKEALVALKNGQTLLEQTTTFPRAGSVNQPVILFCQHAMQLYTTHPRSPAMSNQVLDLLWWATTLTFQSQSILRFLIRILSDREEYTDAKRVFELYVGLVLKARQTAQPDASQAIPSADTESSPDEALVKEASSSHEIDDDTEFVSTLLAGAKLLTRMDQPDEAWRYASLAGDVVQVTKLPAHKKALEVKVEEVKGIVRMLMARNVNPHERAKYQSQSLNHLSFSTTTAPTPTSLYHLAHAYAQARQIPQAIDTIHKSLEMDEKNVESWHLLGILLTSMRDWEAARKAVEAGWRVWEERDERERGERERQVDEKMEDGGGASVEFISKDFAAPTAAAAAAPLVLPTGTFPPLPPLPESPPTSSHNLAQVIRLRMTLNMIIEKTQGCEEAMIRQQELFAFFSARCSLVAVAKQPATASATATATATASGGEKKDVPDREDGLGESFVNIKEQGKSTSLPKKEYGLTFLDSIPATGQDGIPTVAPPIPPTPTPTSFDPAPPSSVEEKQTINENTHTNTLTPFRSISEKGRRRRRSFSASLRSKGGKKDHMGGSTASHDGDGGGGVRRTASLRGTVRDRPVSRSAAPSIVPTAIHSHYRSSRVRRPSPPPPPPPAPTKSSSSSLPTTDTRFAEEKRILSDLWLASAATFRRWGKLEQCLVSVMEAEGLDPGNEDVWVQLGMYHVAHTAIATATSSSSSTSKAGIGKGHAEGQEQGEEGEGEEEEYGAKQLWKPAEEAFSKSLLLKTDHPPALVSLAKLYLSTSTRQNLATSTPTDRAPKRYQGADLAESLLNPFTQSVGWDIPEAWYLLGHVARVQGREERARECWEFALGLEQGRGIRDWSCVKRWL
ncbi:hypothetical protein D1P53_000647 [Cryptococcus gattii VGV]|nr:hypothetical protein D1P53_000647 [Cryptococcus gattii VGV]